MHTVSQPRDELFTQASVLSLESSINKEDIDADDGAEAGSFALESFQPVEEGAPRGQSTETQHVENHPRLIQDPNLVSALEKAGC